VNTRRLTLLLLLCATGAATRIEAQSIGGRLLDLQTDRPIPGGRLTLLAADSGAVARTLSDTTGSWRLRAPEPGLYYVVAEGFGYRRWIAGPVSIAAADDLVADFRLPPEPIELDPIEVRVRALRRYLEFNGFFERQRGNFGHFVTPEEIEKRQATRITDLLATTPGVQVLPGSNGSVGPVQVRLRGSSLSQGGLCRPRVFVDGLLYAAGDSRPVTPREGAETEQEDELLERADEALTLDDIGPPSTIAAIEVYRSASQVPAHFGGTSLESLCGVIVVWTRRGRVPPPR